MVSFDNSVEETASGNKVKVCDFVREGVEYTLRMYEKQHLYKLGGGEFDKLTNIPGVTGICSRLSTFDSNAGKGFVKKHTRAALDERRGQSVDDDLIKIALSADTRYMETARERGNIVHDYLERRCEVPGELQDVPRPATQDQACCQVDAFLAQWEIEPLMSEQIVVNGELRYAGTLDLIARYRNPRTGARGVGIFDLKTGRSVHKDNFAQLAAYVKALEWMGYEELPEQGFVVHTPLGQELPDVYTSVHGMHHDTVSFLAARHILSWMKEPKREMEAA